MLGVRLARIPAVNGAATRSGFAATFQRRRTYPRILRRLGGHSDQRFRRSLTDFAEANMSFFDAAILIFSPLAVLGAGRKGVAFSLGLGNIGSQRRPDPQRSPLRRQ